MFLLWTGGQYGPGGPGGPGGMGGEEAIIKLREIDPEVTKAAALTFGLPEGETLRQISIVWPDGSQSKHTGTDAALEVVESRVESGESRARQWRYGIERFATRHGPADRRDARIRPRPGIRSRRRGFHARDLVPGHSPLQR